MGKIRPKIVGDDEAEQKQKKETKNRREEKKRKATDDTDLVEKNEKAKEEVKEVKKTVKEQKKISVVKIKTHGKKYQAAKKHIDGKKAYGLDEAIKLLKKIKYGRFDETVELHLNVVEAGLKGEVKLPHGTGKTINAVIADDDVVAKIEKGQIDFDVLVAHPSFMPKLVKFARVLGPKGLMPNPKAGTVSTNPQEAIKKFAGGTIRFKTEAKFPILHQAVGKISLGEKELAENVAILINAVGKNKIMTAYLSSTMSPSIKLDVQKIF